MKLILFVISVISFPLQAIDLSIKLFDGRDIREQNSYYSMALMREIATPLAAMQALQAQLSVRCKSDSLSEDQKQPYKKLLDYVDNNFNALHTKSVELSRFLTQPVLNRHQMNGYFNNVSALSKCISEMYVVYNEMHDRFNDLKKQT
ncbi:MAG TPA: hypothetical protein VFF04_06490 [Candidatus Babeliales bacterium]|nr:hypothetical protein [Candidatus Babeliales bacterium]